MLVVLSYAKHQELYCTYSYGLCNYRGESEEGVSSDVLCSSEAFRFRLC